MSFIGERISYGYIKYFYNFIFLLLCNFFNMNICMLCGFHTHITYRPHQTFVFNNFSSKKGAPKWRCFRILFPSQHPDTYIYQIRTEGKWHPCPLFSTTIWTISKRRQTYIFRFSMWREKMLVWLYIKYPFERTYVYV